MKIMCVVLVVMSVLLTSLVIKVGDQNVKISELEREKLAQGWRTYTCAIMISENRRTICAK